MRRHISRKAKGGQTTVSSHVPVPVPSSFPRANVSPARENRVGFWAGKTLLVQAPTLGLRRVHSAQLFGPAQKRSESYPRKTEVLLWAYIH